MAARASIATGTRRSAGTDLPNHHPKKVQAARWAAGGLLRRVLEGPDAPAGGGKLSVAYMGGMMTLSMTWMTPLEASTSAVTTVASFTMTLPELPSTLTVAP